MYTRGMRQTPLDCKCPSAEHACAVSFHKLRAAGLGIGHEIGMDSGKRHARFVDVAEGLVIVGVVFAQERTLGKRIGGSKGMKGLAPRSKHVSYAAGGCGDRAEGEHSSEAALQCCVSENHGCIFCRVKSRRDLPTLVAWPGTPGICRKAPHGRIINAVTSPTPDLSLDYSKKKCVIHPRNAEGSPSRAVPAAPGNLGTSTPVRTPLTCRCDGQRPVCGACLRMDLDCQYESLESSANVILPKDHITDLEQRLKHVEALLARHDDLLTGHLAPCATHATPVEVDEPAEETDGMAITFVDERASAFFGESSNITFIRHLLRAMAAIGDVSEQPAPMPQTHSSPAPAANPTALPPYKDIEDLLTVYFSTMGLMFPIFDEAYFWAKHHEFKATNFSHISRTWLAVLNMILAMATNIGQGSGTNTSTDERMEISHAYYARATALCGDLARRVVSLDVVQYLLLEVLYLQGTQQSVEVWSRHGFLVSTAMALGLHAEQAGRHLQPIERESRRRTWMTIFCLDKVLSLTFGRPAAIHENMVDLPSPWPGRGRRTKRDSYTTDFFGVSVRLYELVGECVACLYDGNLGRQKEWDVSMMDTAAEIRDQLEQWKDGLPAHLSIDVEFTNSSHLNRLRTTLALRYHNLAMLIDRPLLLATLSLSKRRLPQVDAQCVSAQHTIDIVHSVLSADASGSNNLGVWFFTLYYGTSSRSKNA